MRSSTSSSDPRRVPLLDRRVWLGLLVMFGLLEVGTRVRLFEMSKDFRRFRTYPARAETLAKGADRWRVALMGNSATDRGVDASVLEATLAARGRQAHTDLFVADQSRIDTWRFMFERYFAAPGLRPDLVVVTFYENDLEDGNPIEIGRLAQFFTTVRDWPEVLTVNLHGLDDRVSFLLSSGWATYAASDRVRERLLEAVVPGFRPHSEQVNRIIYAHESRRRVAAQAQSAPSYAVLGRLLDRAAAIGVRLCFVAYPTLAEAGQVPYPLAPGLLALLRERGVELVDLRRVPSLRPDLYADEVHLTEVGRRPYSEALGGALADAIRPALSAEGR